MRDIRVLLAHPVLCVNQPEYDIYVFHRVERDFDHTPIHQRVGPMDPWGVEENHLEIGRSLDAHDSISRGLWFWSDDGDLLAQKPV